MRLADGSGGSLNAPLLAQREKPSGGSVGIVGSTANLANAAIGAGVLAFPLAYREAGLILGPLLTLAFAIILGYTLHVIASAADVARERTGAAGSYQEIVRVLLGQRAEKLIIALQAIYLTGCNVCMLMIIRDQVLPPLTAALGASSPVVRWLLPIAAWLVVFPMSLIRDMSWFAFPSSVSQVGIFFAVGVVVSHSIAADFGDGHTSIDHSGSGLWEGGRNGTLLLWGKSPSSVVSSLPLICFGFQCHLTFSLVYDSLANPTPRRIDTVAAGCMFLCATLYVTMGVFGYLLLGDNATADVLSDLTTSSRPSVDVSIARYCVAVKVACSYAMLCHVTKICLKDLTLGYERQLSWPQHVLLTAAFVFVTMLAAMYVPGLQVAMAFSGILVVIMVAIFPGVLKLAITKTASDRLIGWLLIAFGVAVGVVSLVVEVAKLSHK